MTVKILHPLLALIASATNNELSRYVENISKRRRKLFVPESPVRCIRVGANELERVEGSKMKTAVAARGRLNRVE